MILAGMATIIFVAAFIILRAIDNHYETEKTERLALELRAKAIFKDVEQIRDFNSGLQTSMIRNKDELQKKIEELTLRQEELKKRYSDLETLVHQLQLQNIKAIGDIKKKTKGKK